MRKCILVVEDQEDNRQILRDLLTSGGFDMIDIQLPILDGYEATRRIKANPDLKSIPIIVVTSYALSGDEDKARLAGCDDYVAKPFSPRDLLAKIKAYV
jgi:two-component system cell cycle response regulator DivK